MSDHTYKIRKDAHVMSAKSVNTGAGSLPDDIRRLEPVTMDGLNRVKGILFIGDERDFQMGR
jgi:hypothetical protein